MRNDSSGPRLCTQAPRRIGSAEVRTATSRTGRSRRGCKAERCQSGNWPALLIAALALTGCAHTRYERIYCITRAQYEQLKSSQPDKVHSKLTGDAATDVGILAASAIRLRAHDDGLLEVLGGCVDPNK